MSKMSKSDSELIKRIFANLSVLYPLHRSLISDGSRQTLKHLLKDTNHQILRYPSGLSIGDWTVPMEWNLVRGKLRYKNGDEILDAMQNVLTILQYSESFSGSINYQELGEHVFIKPEAPNLVPYRTSYYRRNWGFCMSKQDFDRLERREFEVEIKTNFTNSNLEIGEVVLEGASDKEVVFSSYTCHPRMINNELVGPILLRELIDFVSTLKSRQFTYRFLFMPETIGAICYLSDHLENLKKNVVAGYVVTCFGDGRSWGIVHGPNSSDISARMACRVFGELGHEVNHFSFLERGSDERQFCAPNVNLPFTTLVRSKFGSFPEYHSSGDDLSMITERSVLDSFKFLENLVIAFEKSIIFKSTSLGEPFYSAYDLRDHVGGGPIHGNFQLISNIVAYSNGDRDIVELALILEATEEECLRISLLLEKLGILERL